MSFRDGYWRCRKGAVCVHPSEVWVASGALLCASQPVSVVSSKTRAQPPPGLQTLLAVQPLSLLAHFCPSRTKSST